jgi:peptidoglycan/xylan/chitin deacetylase (PgdA/CDA1 family)
MIIPIVLHRVVESNCIDFEDITIASFDKILSKDSSKYITAEDVDKVKIKSDRVYYLITFDDGYVSDYNIVFPRLKERNIQATFFINPKTVGKKGYVNWDMTQEMSRHGMCIGSHSDSHPNMTKISIDKAKQEFIDSKKSINSKINKNVNFFAFPFGFYNVNLVKLAIKCGYQKCFVSDHGVVAPDRLIIPRNSINKTMSFDDIDEILKCSMSTRMKWKCEDIIKSSLKKIFGVRIYNFIRKAALQ